VGRQSIWEGIHQISRGDLTYKIDTSALQGETYEMACAINEMGDGLQEAVESIIKNERLKAELITNVSHDLKTPLTSIVNYVDLLKRENPEGEKVQHYIAVLEQKAQRLKRLTEDLVEASRISSGNIELDMIELQPGSILEQAYGEFEERFEECGLHAVLQIDREPLTIQADGAQLWRVLENLMGNICKYAKPGTDVFLTLERRETMACLSLRNTSAETLTVEADELTGRFVRGDASRSTEGSGLGLSIAQNLTQLMGGSFRLHTEQEEFEVTVSFPVHS
jgi:signal transduction histidine kinase